MDDVYNITESCGNREFVHTHMGWKKLDGKLTFPMGLKVIVRIIYLHMLGIKKLNL